MREPFEAGEKADTGLTWSAGAVLVTREHLDSNSSENGASSERDEDNFKAHVRGDLRHRRISPFAELCSERDGRRR